MVQSMTVGGASFRLAPQLQRASWPSRKREGGVGAFDRLYIISSSLNIAQTGGIIGR